MRRIFLVMTLLCSGCAVRRATVQPPDEGNGSVPSWVELQPGMELRVEGAYYREGSPRIGLADYLGAETARYEVTPQGALRLVSVSSFLTEQAGTTQPRDQPAVQTLVSPRNLSSRYHRLFFQVVMSGTGTARPAVLLGARSASALDSITRQFLSGQYPPCGAIRSDQCTAFPTISTASLEVRVTVNGTARRVVWGTTLGGVAASRRNIELKRPTHGRMEAIPIDVSDPVAMRTPLLHGDEITWE